MASFISALEGTLQCYARAAGVVPPSSLSSLSPALSHRSVVAPTGGALPSPDALACRAEATAAVRRINSVLSMPVVGLRPSSTSPFSPFLPHCTRLLPTLLTCLVDQGVNEWTVACGTLLSRYICLAPAEEARLAARVCLPLYALLTRAALSLPREELNVDTLLPARCLWADVAVFLEVIVACVSRLGVGGVDVTVSDASFFTPDAPGASSSEAAGLEPEVDAVRTYGWQGLQVANVHRLHIDDNREEEEEEEEEEEGSEEERDDSRAVDASMSGSVASAESMTSSSTDDDVRNAIVHFVPTLLQLLARRAHGDEVGDVLIAAAAGCTRLLLLEGAHRRAPIRAEEEAAGLSLAAASARAAMCTATAVARRLPAAQAQLSNALHTAETMFMLMSRTSLVARVDCARAAHVALAMATSISSVVRTWHAAVEAAHMAQKEARRRERHAAAGRHTESEQPLTADAEGDVKPLGWAYYDALPAVTGVTPAFSNATGVLLQGHVNMLVTAALRVLARTSLVDCVMRRSATLPGEEVARAVAEFIAAWPKHVVSAAAGEGGFTTETAALLTARGGVLGQLLHPCASAATEDVVGRAAVAVSVYVAAEELKPHWAQAGAHGAVLLSLHDLLSKSPRLRSGASLAMLAAVHALAHTHPALVATLPVAGAVDAVLHAAAKPQLTAISTLSRFSGALQRQVLNSCFQLSLAALALQQQACALARATPSASLSTLPSAVSLGDALLRHAVEALEWPKEKALYTAAARTAMFLAADEVRDAAAAAATSVPYQALASGAMPPVAAVALQMAVSMRVPASTCRKRAVARHAAHSVALLRMAAVVAESLWGRPADALPPPDLVLQFMRRTAAAVLHALITLQPSALVSAGAGAGAGALHAGTGMRSEEEEVEEEEGGSGDNASHLVCQLVQEATLAAVCFTSVAGACVSRAPTAAATASASSKSDSGRDVASGTTSRVTWQDVRTEVTALAIALLAQASMFARSDAEFDDTEELVSAAHLLCPAMRRIIVDAGRRF